MTSSLHPTQPEMDSTRRRKLQLYAGSRRDTGLWLLLIGAGVILSTAFSLRGEHWLIPDRGAGYGLGVAGLGAMTALLAYSLRKRLRFARRWGPMHAWFRVHMFLGVAGPVAILLHCNFQLGSSNANAALASALAVSASGVVGRLLYGRIHAGLFGRRLTLLDLRSAIAEHKASLDAEAEPAARLAMEPIERFERDALATRGLLAETLHLFVLPSGRGRALREATAGLGPAAALPDRARLVEQVDAYLDALARLSIVSACERLFALWHVVHLPLCVVLFAAAAVHVVAVHVY